MLFSTNDFCGLSLEAFRATTLDCYLLMDEDTKTWKDEAVYDLRMKSPLEAHTANPYAWVVAVFQRLQRF